MGMYRGRYGEINMETTVSRDVLLERLKKARQQHIETYNEALKNWREALAAAIQEVRVSQIEEFPKELTKLQESCPMQHLAEYDRSIDMFELCTKDEITIDSSTYNKLLRDEWDWKKDVYGNRFMKEAVMTLSAATTE